MNWVLIGAATNAVSITGYAFWCWWFIRNSKTILAQRIKNDEEFLRNFRELIAIDEKGREQMRGYIAQLNALDARIDELVARRDGTGRKPEETLN
jgi:hypothetical protein